MGIQPEKKRMRKDPLGGNQSFQELVRFFIFHVHFYFILFLKIFIFTLFYFTILYWFCHTLTWISHRCTCVPKHEPPSHLPPHNISLGHPCAPAPSMLYPTSDIDWRFEYNWIKEIKYAIAFYLNSLLTVFLFSFIVTNLIVFVKILKKQYCNQLAP